MQPALSTPIAQPLIPAMWLLSENSSLGFASKNPAWNPGPNVVNSTTAIGMRASLVLEALRQTDRARYYNPAIDRFISEDPIGLRGGINQYAYAGDSPTIFTDPSGEDRNPLTCAASNAQKVSFASLTGLGEAGGVTGFAANALGGNAFSGLTDLITSLATGQSGEGSNTHSVWYNMGQSIAAGPSQGFTPVVGWLANRFGSSIADTPWETGPADVATNAIVKAVFNQVTGAGDGIQTLNGFSSIASTGVEDAAAAAEVAGEFATGVGEAKFAYDFATWAGSLAGCAAGLLN